MVAVQQLLDPHARDPQLRAFAYIQARFVKGARSSIDCLQPFVVYAVGQFAGKIFDSRQIADYISQTYRVKIPMYMLEEMTGALTKLGALKYHEIGHALTCENIIKKGALGDTTVDFSIDDITAVENGLRLAAEKRGQRDPVSAPNWGQALINFFQSGTDPAPQPTAVIDKVIVSTPAYLDDKIIGEYILECSARSPDLYQSIERLYYGVLVSDFLTKLERSGNKADYKGLQIVYDTTVLMRLLGTSGSKFRVATLEMHQTLQDLGCQTFYFNHTYTEVLNNIDYIMNAANHDWKIFAETKEALDRGELTLGKLSLLLGTLDAELGKLNITEHPETYETKKKNVFQIDEPGLVEALVRSGRFSSAKSAADFDAKSLALIVRLREGTSFRDVWRTKAIFITHNPTLARVGNRFLEKEGFQQQRSVGAVLTLGQITTVAWLANEIVYEPQRISKELIANCYKAGLPMDGWDSAFWEALKTADPTVAQENSRNLMYVHTAREIALNASRGHPALLPNIDMKKALETAAEQSKVVADQARESGVTAGRSEAIEEISAAAKQRATQLADRITVWVVRAVFLVSAVFLFFSFFIFNESHNRINFVARVVAFAAALLALIDVLKITPVRVSD